MVDDEQLRPSGDRPLEGGLAGVHPQRRLHHVGTGHDLSVHRGGDARADSGVIG